MSKADPCRVRRLLVSRDWQNPSPPAWDEIRIWLLPLHSAPCALERHLAFLTRDELDRAERYKVETARHQFVTTRSVLRQLLGSFLRCAPREVALAFTSAGKPVLADTAVNLHFNVAHTDGLALVAIARQSVGIDVERVRTLDHAEGLVERFFSTLEVEAYRALPDHLRRDGFFRGWTCKEALIKASGMSIACLNEFDVELHPERPPALLGARNSFFSTAPWRLETWEVTPEYVAAVAIEGHGELRGVDRAGEK
jgi:4'-phosphopantetheinyl transferase